MDEEIKEILEYFRKKVKDKIETYTVVDRDTIYLEQLLDYITNLQEKVNQYENPDDLTLFYMWLDEKAKDKMKALQEEIDRLSNIINELEKWLKEQIKIKNKCISNCAGTREYELLRKNEQDLMFFNWVLDKLKESKGEKNE